MFRLTLFFPHPYLWAPGRWSFTLANFHYEETCQGQTLKEKASDNHAGRRATWKQSSQSKDPTGSAWVTTMRLLKSEAFQKGNWRNWNFLPPFLFTLLTEKFQFKIRLQQVKWPSQISEHPATFDPFIFLRWNSADQSKMCTPIKSENLDPHVKQCRSLPPPHLKVLASIKGLVSL